MSHFQGDMEGLRADRGVSGISVDESRSCTELACKQSGTDRGAMSCP